MIKINDKDFERLISYIRDNYGINLSQKRNLIEGRLTNA
ncbi:MAG: chemotaxis protein CheR, partial [Clostridia bacterium]|nr:chemotaxis protein CheR [Clostridia bacterium]